jgi:ABC-type amino acid transport substrate-binding protein
MNVTNRTQIRSAFAALIVCACCNVASAAAPATDIAAPETATPAAEVPAAAPVLPLTALERIRASGHIRLGYVDGARPYSYSDAGKPAGYGIALCEAIAAAVGRAQGTPAPSIEWVQQSMADQDADLAAGRVDVACSAGRATLARRETISFSVPVFPGSIGALVQGDAPRALTRLLEHGAAQYQPFWRAKPAEILEQQTLAAVPGTASEAWLAERVATLKIPSRITQVESLDAGVAAVQTGDVDVLFADRALLLDAARRADGDLTVLDRRFTSDPVALGLPRGDEDLRLLVDRTLSAMYGSGDLIARYTESFGEPDGATTEFFRLSVLPD